MSRIIRAISALLTSEAEHESAEHWRALYDEEQRHSLSLEKEIDVLESRLAATEAESDRWMGIASAHQQEGLEIQARLDGETAGAMDLRRRLGALAGEGFRDFVERLAKERDEARAKAATHERDWYDAKSEFGTAMADMSSRLAQAEANTATYLHAIANALGVTWVEPDDTRMLPLGRIIDEGKRLRSVASKAPRVSR